MHNPYFRHVFCSYGLRVFVSYICVTVSALFLVMFVFFIFFVSRPSNLSAIGRPEAALRIDQSSIALSMSAGGPSVPVTALPGLLAHAQASHHVQSADGLSGPTTVLVAPASHHSPQGGGAAPPSPSMACALTPASALVAQASHQSPQGGGAARPTPSTACALTPASEVGLAGQPPSLERALEAARDVGPSRGTERRLLWLPHPEIVAAILPGATHSLVAAAAAEASTAVTPARWRADVSVRDTHWLCKRCTVVMRIAEERCSACQATFASMTLYASSRGAPEPKVAGPSCVSRERRLSREN